MIDFIIPTYDRVDPLNSMLASLKAQTKPWWVASVIHDKPFDGVINLGPITDGRVVHYWMGKRYNDFGHTPRNKGKQLSKCEWIVMTGDDNYYVPTFVEEFFKCVDSQTIKPGMVYWDMVHSHYNYELFKTLPAYNQIDIGAFATRKDLAQSIPLNTTFAADGEFVEDFKRQFPLEPIVKINKVLYVHN